MKKKHQIPNNKGWFCKCENILGGRPTDNVVTIRGPKGQEYEVGFNYIKVVCPGCHRKNIIQSENLKNVQKNLEILKKNNELSKLAIDSGEIELQVDSLNPLEEKGLKSFYSLEDRHKKILKTKLSEWQNKIFDCLYDMGLDADIGEKEDWDRVTNTIANKLKIKHSKVERDIIKIQEKILDVIRNSP